MLGRTMPSPATKIHSAISWRSESYAQISEKTNVGKKARNISRNYHHHQIRYKQIDFVQIPNYAGGPALRTGSCGT